MCPKQDDAESQPSDFKLHTCYTMSSHYKQMTLKIPELQGREKKEEKETKK